MCPNSITFWKKGCDANLLKFRCEYWLFHKVPAKNAFLIVFIAFEAAFSTVMLHYLRPFDIKTVRYYDRSILRPFDIKTGLLIRAATICLEHLVSMCLYLAIRTYSPLILHPWTRRYLLLHVVFFHNFLTKIKKMMF